MDEPFTRLAQRVGRDDQLAATARLVFAALDCFLDKRTGRCAPSVDRLAGWVGFNRRTVLRALRELEAAGYIAIDRSCGRRNAYRLLPVTGDNSGPVTGDKIVTGTGDKIVTGFGDSDRIGLKNKRERTGAPSLDLFAGQYREWFTAAVAYHLADVAELAPYLDWFPALASEFFLGRSWHRSTDPETAVAWARRLAAIAAMPAEVLEAFHWAEAGPAVDYAGRKVFSRPDHLARILYRVQSQRKRIAGPAAEASAADMSLAEFEAARATSARLMAARRGGDRGD